MDSGTIYEQTTICARATAPGHGAIAVVRISGPEAVTVLERVYRPMKEEGGVRAAGGRRRSGGGIPGKGDALRADYFP